MKTKEDKRRKRSTNKQKRQIVVLTENCDKDEEKNTGVRPRWEY
jgi:hypothetical protein